MMRILVFCIFLLVAATGYCEPVKDLKNAPTEVQLACLNIQNKPTSNPDQVKVARFKYLLESLEKRHASTKKEIANTTLAAQGAMREKGISESLLEIMESINKSDIPKRLGKIKYSEVGTAYAVLRVSGMSKDEASAGIGQMLKGVVRK